MTRACAGTAARRRSPASKAGVSDAQARLCEARLQRDLDAGQRLRDRAAGLRLLRGALEVVVRDPRDAGDRGQLDPRDREAAVGLVEVDARGRLDRLRRVAGPAKATGEGHGEAAGVGRADELLRVRARPLLEARAERVGALV